MATASRVEIRPDRVTRIQSDGKRTHAPKGEYKIEKTNSGVEFSSDSLGERFVLEPYELAQYEKDGAFIFLDGDEWPG